MNDEERMKQLLKQAVRPVEVDAEPPGDLWPAVLQRLDGGAPRDAAVRLRWIWFDVALLASIAIMGISFPATISLLLYYL